VRNSKFSYAVKSEHQETPKSDDEIDFLHDGNKARFPLDNGRSVYLFCDDSSPGAKDGGLIGRGVLVDWQRDPLSTQVRFDGIVPTTKLMNHQLDAFKTPTNPSQGIARESILSGIAEIRRATKKHMVYELPEDCATWLDVYHF
jgi:hypothetical protein